jgi:hypothetical protein
MPKNKQENREITFSGAAVQVPQYVIDLIEKKRKKASDVSFFMTPKVQFRDKKTESYYQLVAFLKIGEKKFFAAQKLGSPSLTIGFSSEAPDTDLERDIKKTIKEKICGF